MIKKHYQNSARLLLFAYITLIFSGLFHTHASNIAVGEKSSVIVEYSAQVTSSSSSTDCPIHNSTSSFYNFLVAHNSTCSVETLHGTISDQSHISQRFIFHSSIQLRAPPQA